MLNIAQVREEFPILQKLNRFGLPLVYFDNAATTQKPRGVLQAIQDFYTQNNSNIHRGAYELAEEATNAYDASREKVQTFIGAGRKEEIVFVRGATEGINLIASSYLQQIKSGKNIVITGMEHHANLLPWQYWAQQKNLELRVIPLLDDGQLDMQQAEALIDGNTCLVATVHISNSLGTINPVKQLAELAHANGAKILIDAAQSVPHMPVNVQELDCDFLVCSGHKLYGPTGIGFLYGKHELLDAMEPYQLGGAMIRYVSFEESSFREVPYRFEAGTPNIAGAIGLAAAIDFLESIGMEQVKAHGEELLRYATALVESLPGFEIIGNAPEKSGILSIMLEHVHPHDISTLLDAAGIAIRAGHHCNQPLMRSLEIPGTARISFGVYNTIEEIDYLVEKLVEVKEVFR